MAPRCEVDVDESALSRHDSSLSTRFMAGPTAVTEGLDQTTLDKSRLYQYRRSQNTWLHSRKSVEATYSDPIKAVHKGALRLYQPLHHPGSLCTGHHY